MNGAKELADLLHKNRGLNRVMKLLLDKFERYGESKGKITLNNASREECEALNAFLTPKKFYRPPDISFKISDFEKAIKNSRYSEVSLKELLEEYFHRDIMKNSDKKQAEQAEIQNFFEPFKDINWLSDMLAKKNGGYKLIMNEYKSDRSKAEFMLQNVIKAVSSRFEKDFSPVKLSVLSAEITGNSHYFDFENTSGKLLLNAIAFYAQEENITDKYKLYDFFGIEIKNMMSTAAVCSIDFFDVFGKRHEGFAFFADKKEPLLVTDVNLSGLYTAQSKNKVVFIVENPSVFMELVSTVSETSCGLVCTFGQIKSVGYQLIDMLVKGGCEIFYAGDFDPEGLLIAENLMKRYGKIKAWRMSCKDYAGIAKNSDIISQRRLNILEKIEILKETALQLKETKQAAYQELLIKEMSEDIKKAGADK